MYFQNLLTLGYGSYLAVGLRQLIGEVYDLHVSENPSGTKQLLSSATSISVVELMSKCSRHSKMLNINGSTGGFWQSIRQISCLCINKTDIVFPVRYENDKHGLTSSAIFVMFFVRKHVLWFRKLKLDVWGQSVCSIFVRRN